MDFVPVRNMEEQLTQSSLRQVPTPSSNGRAFKLRSESPSLRVLRLYSLERVRSALAFGEKLGRESLSLVDALDFNGYCFDGLLHSLETTRDLRRDARILCLCVDLSRVRFRQRNSNCEDGGGDECAQHNNNLGFHVSFPLGVDAVDRYTQLNLRSIPQRASRVKGSIVRPRRLPRDRPPAPAKKPPQWITIAEAFISRGDWI